MSETTKMILIVGGVGLAAYLLVDAVAPKKAAASKAPTVNSGSFAAGLGGFLGGLVGGAATSSKPASNNPSDSTSAAVYHEGDSFDDYATGLFGPGTSTD